MRDWAKRLPVICDGYEPRNIFNADETGLFFRALPTKSMVTKGDLCNGGKNSKDRITVLLAASATGEKLRPLVIGKSKKPRAVFLWIRDTNARRRLRLQQEVVDDNGHLHHMAETTQ